MLPCVDVCISPSIRGTSFVLWGSVLWVWYFSVMVCFVKARGEILIKEWMCKVTGAILSPESSSHTCYSGPAVC